MHSQPNERSYFCPTPFLWAFALYLLAILPIIRADRFYVDDMGRALTGYLGWSGDGRPLANVFMEVFNLGTPLTDISPLPQIVSVALLAALAVSVAGRFRIPGNILPALIVAPLVISPFFLENLSYKFDALTMTLALFLAVMTVLKTRDDLPGVLLGTLGLVASLSLYQAAFNAFLVFAAVEFVDMQQRDEPVAAWGKRIVVRAAQALGALMIYKPIAASSIKGGYAALHSQLATVSELPAIMGRNLSLFWTYVNQALTGIWGRTLLIWIAAAILIALALSLRYLVRHWATATPGQRLVMGLAALGVVPGFVLAPWGPLTAMLHPMLLPRTMIGFGALAAAASLLIGTAWPAMDGTAWTGGDRDRAPVGPAAVCARLRQHAEVAERLRGCTGSPDQRGSRRHGARSTLPALRGYRQRFAPGGRAAQHGEVPVATRAGAGASESGLGMGGRSAQTLRRHHPNGQDLGKARAARPSMQCRARACGATRALPNPCGGRPRRHCAG
jgi:hypothetical protein